MQTTYDGIILGAGHNGMIPASLSRKAGMKVLTIERKAVTGGGLATLEETRAIRAFSTTRTRFFQREITAMPWYADLDLERHGAHYVEPELKRRTANQ